jgi:hypothetical protein
MIKLIQSLSKGMIFLIGFHAGCFFTIGVMIGCYLLFR